MTKHAVTLPTNNQEYHSAEPFDRYSRAKLSNFRRSLKRHRDGRRKLFSSSVPPASRLVGIELNPGPPKKGGLNRAIANAVGQAAVKNRRNRRKNKRANQNAPYNGRVVFQTHKTGNPARANHPSLRTYINALTNPFNTAQPKLGFGTYVPTTLVSGWFENAAQALPAAVISTATCFAVTFSPGIDSDNIRIYGAVSSGSLLSATAPVTGAVANAANLTTRIQTARVVSSELRVKVRTAATSLPGTLGGIFLPDETMTSIQAMSFQGLGTQQKFCPFSSESNIIGGAVQYRPLDGTSFEFSTQYGQGGVMPLLSSRPTMIIVGQGWPAGAFAIEISIIEHLEATSGIDSAGEVDFNGSLASTGVNVDQVGNEILQMGPPIVPSIPFIEMLDNGISHAMSKSDPTFGRAVQKSFGSRWAGGG